MTLFPESLLHGLCRRLSGRIFARAPVQTAARSRSRLRAQRRQDGVPPPIPKRGLPP